MAIHVTSILDRFFHCGNLTEETVAWGLPSGVSWSRRTWRRPFCRFLFVGFWVPNAWLKEGVFLVESGLGTSASPELGGIFLQKLHSFISSLQEEHRKPDEDGEMADVRYSPWSAELNETDVVTTAGRLFWTLKIGIQPMAQTKTPTEGAPVGSLLREGEASHNGHHAERECHHRGHSTWL